MFANAIQEVQNNGANTILAIREASNNFSKILRSVSIDEEIQVLKDRLFEIKISKPDDVSVLCYYFRNKIELDEIDAKIAHLEAKKAKL